MIDERKLRLGVVAASESPVSSLAAAGYAVDSNSESDMRGERGGEPESDPIEYGGERALEDCGVGYREELERTGHEDRCLPTFCMGDF